MKTAAPSPKVVSLAIRTASSSSRAEMIAATGPEQLLVVGGHALRHAGEDGRRVEGARACGCARRPGGPSRPSATLFATCWCSSSRRSRRACGPTSTPLSSGSPILRARILSTKSSSKRRLHRLDHDEALGRDAALAAVDEPGRHAALGRELEIGVLQHEVGIAAAQLQHRLLEQGPGLRGHGLAGGRAAGEGDRAAPRGPRSGRPRARSRRAGCGRGRRGSRRRGGSPRWRARCRTRSRSA